MRKERNQGKSNLNFTAPETDLLKGLNNDNVDNEDQRPTTARLEAPLILDPQLIDKLDMSLLSKECLSISLTRIDLSQGKKIISPRVLKKKHILPSSSSRSKAAKVISDGAQSTHVTSLTKNHEIARTVNTDVSIYKFSKNRRLDSNSNNENDQWEQSQLSLRCYDLEGTVSILNRASASNGHRMVRANFENSKKKKNLSVVKGNSFHHASTEYPKQLTMSLMQPLTATLTHLPVRTMRSECTWKPSTKTKSQTLQHDSHDSPVLTIPRSINFQNFISASIDGKVNNIELLRIRKIKSASSSKPNDNKTTGKRRPKSVTCYICGREFGSASFPIHEPKCFEKWQRENNQLPVAHRRNNPVRPKVPIDHEDWNAAAWEQSQALLVPCLKCKRTFQPDRLIIHERNCRTQNKVFY